MMCIEQQELVDLTNSYGEIINAPENLLSIHFSPRDDGIPYVKVENNKFFYSASERGYLIFEKETADLDEVLYFLFDRITTTMSTDYELKHRVHGRDSRRKIFAKQIELLGQINPMWAERCKKEIAAVLESSPFDDFAAERSAYCRELREIGIQEKEIERLSSQKYPYPQE